MYIYYPSCNFSAASPATAKKVKAYFEKQMPVAGSCRVDKREISPADIALYICQACRETLEDKVKTQSMWEYLDALKDFNFPNLNGQKFYVQDCWRDRNHPEIHEAVRSLLKKMHAEVIEIEHNREKSIFCGNLHYETDDPRLKNYPNTPLYRQLSQIGRSSLSFELPLSFEQAAAYRKANGQYVRKNQWRDTTVRVFIDLD